jgi:hypothetical protein
LKIAAVTKYSRLRRVISVFIAVVMLCFWVNKKPIGLGNNGDSFGFDELLYVKAVAKALLPCGN